MGSVPDTTPDPVAAGPSAVLHLIGGPFVSRGAGRLEVPEGSKRLLAFVALHRRQVERRYAAGALWPDVNEGRAAGNLRSALWRLRGVGIDVLDVDKWSLELRPDVSVDVHHVADWAERLVAGTPEPSDLRIGPRLSGALDLLPGWYDDWALLERERCRQRTLHGLEALSRELVARGRPAEAVDVALHVVGAEPMRESAQRVLIEAHLAEGNRVEALRAYSLHCHLLRDELGVGPSDALERLLRPIRSAAQRHIPGRSRSMHRWSTQGRADAMSAAGDGP